VQSYQERLPSKRGNLRAKDRLAWYMSAILSEEAPFQEKNLHAKDRLAWYMSAILSREAPFKERKPPCKGQTGLVHEYNPIKRGSLRREETSVQRTDWLGT
jgi:hypothetical protein